MPQELTSTSLWKDTADIPQVLQDVLLDSPERSRLIDLIKKSSRLVITGNGAAFYSALALQSELHSFGSGVEVIPVQAGTIASGAFTWKLGDFPLVFSASGELRDIVAACASASFPPTWGVVTNSPDSTLAQLASVRVITPIESQNAVTHTQAYAANVLTAILLASSIGGQTLGLETLIDDVAGAIEQAPAWAALVAPTAMGMNKGIAFASGAQWTQALETALLFKEVAGVAVEGLETREAATSGMYALAADSLVLSHGRTGDALAAEAESVCRSTGATLIRFPETGSSGTAGEMIASFPFAVALAATLGLARGRDVDDPPWTTAYYSTARTASS